MKALFSLNQRFARLFLACVCYFLAFHSTMQAQNITLDGYVFEENNRGFLNEAHLMVLDFAGAVVGSDTTDMDGHFSINVPFGRDYIILSEKRVFKTKYDTINSANAKMGEKVFVKIELERQPGYLFEVTLAEKRTDMSVPADAISGARVEIYNNTKKQTVFSIDSTKNPVFSYTFEQGNHYTILARKKGYFNKRMEAHVNIDGCILCFEGVGTVTPGVVDNISLAKNNQLGTLLSNVELERIDPTRILIVNNIYYDVASSNLRADAKKELDKLANVLKINPHIVVEIGSHTDSRGSAEANMALSNARAQAAVDYLITKGNLKSNRIKAKGYGETLLANGCRDGVPCSDAQHEQNRRTELKIVGVTNDPFADISLAEIIHAEELEKFVASGGGFSDEVYVAPQSIAPTNPTPKEEVKEVAKVTKIEPKPTPKTVEKITTEAQPTFKVLEVEKAPLSTEPIKSKIEKPNLAAKATSTKPYPKLDGKAVDKSLEKTAAKEAEAKAIAAKEKATKEAEAKVVAAKEKAAKEAEAAREKAAEAKAITKPTAITPELPKVDEQAVVAAPQTVTQNVDLASKGNVKPNGIMKIDLQPIPADFSGYSVELITLPNVVPKDSPILQGIAEQISSNIFIEKRVEGVAYTAGSFETWGEVQDFQAKAAQKYPKAKVVEYFKGKRIE